MLSTLKAYFLGQKELFSGLAIEKLENAEAGNRELWQEYPVLYLDFNAKAYTDEQALLDILNVHLRDWEEAFVAERRDDAPDSRLKDLIQHIYQKTGKQVVVLVDEYDKPLLETMNTDEALNETYRRILKGFYGVFKSCDQYLRFVFLTGVTKFSKVSIFSDLNNLRDISLDRDYAALCGITQQELEANFQPEIQILTEPPWMAVVPNSSKFRSYRNLLSRNVQGGTFLDAGAVFGDGIDEDTPNTWVAETLVV